MDKRNLSVGGVLIVIVAAVIFAFSNRGDADIVTTSDDNGDSYSVSDNSDSNISESSARSYIFRKDSYLTEHYEKHGIEMGFKSEEDYLSAANKVINNPDALHKNEAEDGDDIYYIKGTDEIVFVSTDGYIRTYFICSGYDYFNRQ